MTRRLLPLVCLIAVSSMACPAEGPIVELDAGEDAAAQDATTDDMAPAGFELTSLSPAEGSAAGGTEVTLTGSGFEEGMTVRFGTTAAVESTVVSETEATVTTPAVTSPGAVTVVIRNSDGESSSLTNGFRFIGEDEAQTIDFCQLQAQSPVSATTGVASEGIYAVVFAEGITGGSGQGPGIEGELGYGTGSDFASFDFVTMSYNVDKDGLTPGDVANDEYGASLTITTEGTYRYVARFRTTDEEDAEWTYCDLNGSDDGATEDQLGTIEVTDPAIPTVGFCRTTPARTLAVAGAATPLIEGTVFAAGTTPGAGAAANVTGELVWGDAAQDPSSWTQTAAATYAFDADGLVGGDLANDVWTASLTPAQAGTYGYAFRFSVDGGTTFTLCDVDGSSEADPFAANGEGILEVTATEASVVDFCRVFQTALDVSIVDDPPLVTVEVFDAPATEGNGGANAGEFTAEAGWGAVGANPAISGAYAWTPMSYKGLRPGFDNNYEYESGAYAAGMKPPAGTYRVITRVRHTSDDVWTYCDTDESNNGFRLDAATSLLVRP